MKSKGIYFYLILFISAVLLLACNDKEIAENNKDVVGDETLGDSTKNNEDFYIISLANLVGKSDNDVIAIMGEGSKTTTEDGLKTLQREYSYNLDKDSLLTTVSYDENQVVKGVFTSLPDYDITKWETLLTRELGTPTKMEQTSDGVKTDDIVTVLWRNNLRLITLFASQGSLSIIIE